MFEVFVYALLQIAFAIIFALVIIWVFELVGKPIPSHIQNGIWIIVALVIIWIMIRAIPGFYPPPPS